mgnify:CR=1 FL=1
MLIRTESEAVAMIREANFEEYIRQAQNSSNWYSSLVKESEHEYRHFLLLHWCSRITVEIILFLPRQTHARYGKNIFWTLLSIENSVRV